MPKRRCCATAEWAVGARWQPLKDGSRLHRSASGTFATIQKRSEAELDRPGLARAEQRELRAAFDSVDIDGGGTLSVGEIGDLLAALGQTNTDAELRAKMREIDGASGTLDFEEFVVAMDKW